MDLSALPHHDGSSLYVSNGSPEIGDGVIVRLRVPADLGVVEVQARSLWDKEPSLWPAVRSAVKSGVDWWEARLTVTNPVTHYRFVYRTASGDVRWVNATGVHRTEPRDIEDFALSAHAPAPEWIGSQVLYQVFPDRFARSAAADAHPAPEWAEPAAWTDPVNNERPHTGVQFYGGDLWGVIDKLDHIVNLGATLLYLTPFFAAGSNHRYDSHDFAHVDPLLGGDEALIALIEAAHQRGLKVIGDLTTNHCGDGHEWFRAAVGNPDAPESEFFYWTNAEHTEYAAWLGVPSLPKFNWESAELRRRFIEGPDSVVATWLKKPFGLDGWRIDVANMTGRYGDVDINEDIRRIIRRTMIDINPDTILLGESTNDAAFDFRGDAWHGAMSYSAFTRPVWAWLSDEGSEAAGGIGMVLSTIPEYSGADVHTQYTELSAGFPWRIRQGNLVALDTHDTPRFAGIAREGAVEPALLLSLTLPGIPVVFAGDELGLVGRDGEESRTPMPWDSLDAAADRIALYTELIHLKRDHSALNGGSLRWLHIGDDVLAFVREDTHESLLVVVSRAEFEFDIDSAAVSARASKIRGTAQFIAAGDRVTVSGSGMSATVWSLAVH